MNAETAQSNGKSKISLPTFGCQGCQNRKEIMGAGDWKVDVAVIFIIAALCVVLYKVKIT